MKQLFFVTYSVWSRISDSQCLGIDPFVSFFFDPASKDIYQLHFAPLESPNKPYYRTNPPRPIPGTVLPVPADAHSQTVEESEGKDGYGY